MLIPVEKLKEWAATVEPVTGQHILKFITEAEAKMKGEVDHAMHCLGVYGYKVYEDQHHDYHKM